MTLARRRSKEQKARAAEKAQRARAEAARRRRRRRRAAAPPEAPPGERITVEDASQQMVNYLSHPCTQHEDCRDNLDLGFACAKTADLRVWWAQQFETNMELRHTLEVLVGARPDRKRREGERWVAEEFWELVGKAERSRSA